MSGAKEPVAERPPWWRVARWFDSVATLGFPLRCPVCGATTELDQRPWCSSCARQVRLWSEPVCPECRRFRSPNRADCPGGHEEAQPRFVVALGAYDFALGVVVHALKYEGLQAVAAPLGQMLAERVRAAVQCSAVVPVPTARRKRRERGFGHAELIAGHLAQQLETPHFDDAIRFARRVADQTRLSPAQRRANMHEAFAVRPGAGIKGKDVLVVDDVMTTGATITEAARALLAAGAATVTGAIVALNLGSGPQDR